ncbi:alpha-N-acetylgalactosaminidase-like [Arctopsyche grandis]|uniref:alpha-N-acetylgalactosaminidase-like n=1 Tax=Arctopsyche grandis TaxID=121162 RepID=UPI00406D9775
MIDSLNLLVMFILILNCVVALNNGLAKTPPMGWMSWGRYRCNTDCDNYPTECISEDLFKAVADEFISGGYADVGYEYIIIDDCWMENERDYLGKLMPDYRRFPSGIENLSEYIHSYGLKFGMYENYGNVTCEGYPGSKYHIATDVQQFAEWKIDYLKLDGCFTLSKELDYGFPEFSKQLNKTGRPIVFSCSWPYYQEHIFNIMPQYELVKKYCNLWRNYHDISSSWQSIKNTINFYGKNHKRMASYAGSGHWNDPDMLMIGNPGLSVSQCRIQMAMWAILAAPLIMSNDLIHISKETKDILLNREIIAVDQDPLGIQGSMFKDIFGDLKIWTRPLIPVINDYNSYAIAFINMHDKVDRKISVNIYSLGLKSPDGYTIMDLFTGDELRNITPNDVLQINVNPMDIVFYKLIIL